MKNHVIRISFTSLFTFYFATIFGQSEISRIDKFAIATQARTLDSLHYKLTYKFGSDEEKVRAIFRWITFNISYDLIGVNKKNIYSEIHKKLENVDSSTYEENLQPFWHQRQRGFSSIAGGRENRLEPTKSTPAMFVHLKPNSN